MIPPLFSYAASFERRFSYSRLLLNAFSCHFKGWRSKPGALDEHVEVNPFEHELGDVVHLRVFQEAHRTDDRQRICSGVWLSGVVEVDDVGFPEA
ncbi:hypothetical protein SAMN02745220_01400 [Desulfopila aestuarii DSM 18488]|uniref:Uncharacterized protein n=1 Tax=Desulfopila aestuarii DSM 18488 TaxID=1121416 RepID=A0A1M7Y2Q8_9BACT|nr:hypothetical protein [Desulfopila aestuarii]SHO46272.1 hypothetical protein SAMN02745220_01400 [Desulfopila aestuarii DSM 18488]